MLRAVTSAGVVTTVLEDWFSYRGNPDDIAQFDVATGNEEPILERLGGVSGGPVFRVISHPVLRLALVGVVSEGTPVFGHPSFKFTRRLDVIELDGRIA
jgi:hypothetical protein